MVDLPVEIWQHIFSYLVHSTSPKSEALKLHGLNRHLREIALDYLFKGQPLNVAKLHDANYFQKLEYLREPSIAFRVRSLYIGSFQPSRCKDKLPLYTRTLSKLTPQERTIDEEEVQQLGNMIHSLPKINFVNLYCGGAASNDFVVHTPLVLSAMQSYSKTLRTLALGIASFDILSLIFAKLPHFPHLEKFSLSFSGEGRDTQLSTIVLKDGVLPFLNNHFNSLTNVAIHRQSSCKKLDISPLYDDFPLLYKLKILAVDLKSVTSLERLLNRHSESLEELHLSLTDVPANDEIAMDDCFSSINAPSLHLKRLTITSHQDDPQVSSQAFVDYLSGHSNKLSTLTLLGSEIPPNDWDRLSSLKWSKLVSLSLSLSRAPAKVFDNLVKNLPALLYLTLSVRAFSFTAEVPYRHGLFFRKPPDETEFLTDMPKRFYPNAQVIHLTLSSHNSYQTFYNDTFTACVQAVVKVFPTVLCVNGHSRVDFLKYAPEVLANEKNNDELCF
ncbi:hypothetical protein CPB83DRAFT_885130 [Crepidotus variabilis]|uniref:F-box domain-containing protein n=1 Tax=Crepidotus variabilis TaxID=179855 RepID=A0A9P6EBR2_9AGAR|nr:hypothetical protein CPB83DRAFT_885130 [Crepidotus variabilis]